MERVKEILKLNKEGNKPIDLLENEVTANNKSSFSINSDLEAMDQKFSEKGNKKKKRKKNRFKGKKKPTTEKSNP